MNNMIYFISKFYLKGIAIIFIISVLLAACSLEGDIQKRRKKPRENPVINPEPSIPAPGAPIVTASDRLLTIRWPAVEEAEKYEVYVSTSQSPPASPEKTVSVTTTIVDRLINKTVYYVWIKAINETGNSDFSPRASGIPWPANEIPSTPGRPVIIAGVNQLTVTWEESGGASSYEVYSDTTPTPPSTPKITTDKTSAVIRDLENDGIYYIWVRAVNSAGKSGYSPVEAGTPRIPTVAPAAPSQPVLVAHNRELAVSWQAVELAAAYEVWMGISANSTEAQKQGDDRSDTETVLSGLDNETTYYVWIKAKNNIGTSGFSPSANAKPSAFTVLPETPAMPVIIPGNRALDVSWQPVEGALLYEVWSSVTNNSANAQKYGTDIAGTSVTVSELVNGTTYYLWIKAKNHIGESDFSPAGSGTPSALAATPPAPSSAPVVTAGSGQLTLSWQLVEGASVYEIWMGTTDNTNAATKQGDDVPGLSAVITGLTNGTTCYVWIRAKNSIGTSGFSPVASGTPSVFTVAPQAPSAPAADIGNGQISISWAAVAGATAYEIWLATENNSATAAKHGGDVSASLSATIGGLTNGTTYYIWLKAKNNAGASDFSPAASGKPIGTPGAPTVSPGYNQLSVSWTVVAGADQYEVYYGTGDNPPQTVAYTVNAPATTATITGLVNGTHYNVWIRAKNSIGTSDFSPMSSGIPLAFSVTPQAPSAPSVTIGNGQITVGWTAVEGSMAYEIWLGTSNDSAAAAKNGDDESVSLSRTITGLNNGTTYYIWLKAKNNIGESDFSPAASGKPIGTPGTPTVSPGYNQLSVSWTAVAGADQYEVYYGTDTPPTTLATTTAGTMATITGLLGGTTYYIRLRAKNANGVSDFGPSANNVPSNALSPGLYRGTTKIGDQNLSAALSYISANAVNGDDFFIVLGANESDSSGVGLYYSGKTVGITLIGYGGERTITLIQNNRFIINPGVTLTIDENISLIGRNTNNAALVHVGSNGTLIMNDRAKISGNINSETYAVLYMGGGIYVASGGTFIMNGGTISGNIASANGYGYGGGIHVASGGTFTMNGGTISGNTAKSGGGILSYGTFTMNGGTISGNTADTGGGISAEGTFTMNGGTISGNTVSNHGGGISAGGTFTMNGGTISGNTVNSSYGGGGISVFGTFTMNGGTISGNTVSNGFGGGIFMFRGTFTMYDGTISGNTTKNYGGGIYVSTSGTFRKLPPRGEGQNSGIIYGSEVVGNDAEGIPLKNTDNGNGHAIYFNTPTGSVRQRSTTAGQTDQIDSTTGRGLSTNGEPPYGQ